VFDADSETNILADLATPAVAASALFENAREEDTDIRMQGPISAILPVSLAGRRCLVVCSAIGSARIFQVLHLHLIFPIPPPPPTLFSHLPQLPTGQNPSISPPPPRQVVLLQASASHDTPTCAAVSRALIFVGTWDGTVLGYTRTAAAAALEQVALPLVMYVHFSV
jgi:hypothetical protein